MHNLWLKYVKTCLRALDGWISSLHDDSGPTNCCHCCQRKTSVLSRCVQGLRVQEMTNGFIERMQAPADCCSTLGSTPEKLAHCTNSRFISHVGALHALSSPTERNRGGWLVRCPSYSVLKSMLLCFGSSTSADLYCFESPVPEHRELLSCSSDLVTFPLC